MKAAFVVDSGPKVGLGHLGRCAALAQEFKCRKVSPAFFVTEQLGKKWLATKGFSSRAVFSGTWDFVIADSYRLSSSDFTKIRRSAKQWVMFNDIGPAPKSCDWVLNSSPSYVHSRYQKNRAQLLLGPKYHPLRSEIGALRPARLKEDVKNVFVTLGGIVWGKRLEQVVKTCADILPQATFHIVMGQRGKPFTLKGRRLVFHMSPRNIGSLMKKCDMAVSGGGQTLYELAYLGVPTVAIQLISNQSAIVRGFERAGFIIKAGNLGKAFQRVAGDFHLRKKMAHAGNRLVDGRGAERVVGRVLAPK